MSPMGNSNALISRLVGSMDGSYGKEKELPASSICFSVPIAMLSQGETGDELAILLLYSFLLLYS